jgi:hypothetical protein
MQEAEMSKRVALAVLWSALAVLVAVGPALAAKPGKQRAKGPNGSTAATTSRPRRGHYTFGHITAVSGNTITLKPETPDFVAQRAAASGRQPRALPASITFNVDEATTYQRQGQAAKLGDYKPGDEIAAVLAGKVRSGQGVALRLLDISTVQANYGKGKGLFGPRPVYGTVVALNGSSLRIQPETPDFVLARREQRRAAKAAAAGMPAPAPRKTHPDKQRPETTATLTAQTEYWRDSQRVTADPFKVGDKVAIYPAAQNGGTGLIAASVRDYATVQSGAARKGQPRARKATGTGKGKHRRKSAAAG